MYALTLRQPWASAVQDGHKQWETRGWKPSAKTQKILQTEGFLIHSSGKFYYDDVKRMNMAPFDRLYPVCHIFPLGKLLCHVYLGRIITTEEWREEFKPHQLTGDQPPSLTHHPIQEHGLGDYSASRFAWELKPGRIMEMAKGVAKVSGKLNLWQCPPDLFVIY